MQNISLDLLIFIVFLFNFIIISPFSWGAANREMYFSIIFLFSFLYIVLRNKKLRFLLVLLSILLIYFGTTFFAIYARHQSVPWAFAHDSVFQNEIAGRMLLLGKNPYQETYFDSGLENFSFSEGKVNPALYNLATLPFLLVLNTFLQPIFAGVFGFFDGRFIYIIALIFFLFLLIRRFKDYKTRSLLFILFFLNPITARHFADGRSDFLITVFLFLVVFLLAKKHYYLSGLVFALAFASKLTAWIFSPFLLVYLFANNQRKNLFKFLSSFFILSSFLFLPFLIWDFNSFINDAFSFFIKGGEAAYPITGYGFSKILLDLGYIKSNYDYYPFWIWQIVFSLPLLVYLLLRQRKKTGLGELFLNYGLFLLVFWWFSHHFNDNYISYLTQIFTLGYFLNKFNYANPKSQKNS